MLMLTLGVLLWSVAHLFKRLAPAVREGMGDLGKLFAFVELGLNAAKLSNISRFSLFNQTKIRLRLTK